jgi:GalNAc-alpha-(1->4)-GalNAc-alpha-(1->3)-diNAcBac-PP-undecaprenol alpha-1,4-N-acetyl-D-galactosaminyltransferase
MKKLMIITGGLGTGGLERISCFVANTFSNKGWKVVILTLLQTKSEEKSFQNLNNDVDVIPFYGHFDPLFHKKKAIKYWRKMIKENTKKYAPDSILTMTFKIASLVCLFAPKYASRVTIREISDPKSKVRNQFVNKLTEFFCRNVKNIIFQTNWEKNCYGKRIQHKGEVIPNPLSICVNYAGGYSEKKIFTLSRLLLNQKRQDVLIRAFELFHDNHPDYYLEIFGKGDDEGVIQQMINKSICKDFIKIIKPIPNVHSKIINYRCFVLTSDFEGMSNALLECYSMGVPCVSSDWPGVEDIITNGTDGLIYKRQDANELAMLLSRIADDNDLCNRLTKNAVVAKQRFDEKTIIDKYCEVIERE